MTSLASFVLLLVVHARSVPLPSNVSSSSAVVSVGGDGLLAVETAALRLSSSSSVGSVLVGFLAAQVARID